MLMQLAKFAVLAGVTFFIAWLAGTGRVAYMLVMLWIAAALALRRCRSRRLRDREAGTRAR